MFAQGMFQIDQNATPDQIKRKRELLAAMMPQYGSAKYVGQGLGQLFTGIAQGRMNKSLDKAEDNQRSRISDLFSRAMGGQGGGAQAPAYSGFNIAPIPADPNSPQGIANDAMVALGKAPDYAALETQYGLPSGYLARTAQIESGGNPNAQNPNSSAGGPFQFIDSTAAQYGLTDRFDPVASADAAARLAKDNAEVLRRALGREPTAAELYLAHQQGAGGAAKLLAAGDAPAAGVVGRAAIDLNGGAGMTARDFANQWVDKFNGGQGAATVQPANMDVATWAEIANSPYADPGQRAYAQTMLDQIMRQNDPMYQMGLEKSRLELDALRNPQPKDTRTDDMREYAFAAQQAATRGQPVPTFDEWSRANRAAGATTINNTLGGEVGTIPQGYELFTNPETGARSMRAIAGGPEDTTGKDEKAQSNADVASDAVLNATDRALEAAKNRNFGSAGTSFVAGLPIIGAATDSGEVVRQVEVLKSQAITGNLQAMRDASPTGGALGAVTAPELALLAAKSGALDPNSPNFERDLKDYTRTLLRTIHGNEAGDAIYNQKYGDDGWQVINGVKVRVKQ